MIHSTRADNRPSSGPILTLAAVFSLTNIAPDYMERARRAWAAAPTTRAADDAMLLATLRSDPALLPPLSDALLARLARAGAVTTELTNLVASRSRRA
jgi:hypothetical protein